MLNKNTNKYKLISKDMSVIKFFKTKKVKSPERGTIRSAGIDFFIPDFTDDFISDFLFKNPNMSLNLEDKTIFIGAGKRILIPSGIKMLLPEGFALIGFNKSGISSEFGLDVLACVIDEDYQGEIHISLVNTSHSGIDVYSGQKIVQFVLIEMNYSLIQEVNSLQSLYPTKTIRGTGGFGSTNVTQSNK